MGRSDGEGNAGTLTASRRKAGRNPCAHMAFHDSRCAGRRRAIEPGREKTGARPRTEWQHLECNAAAWSVCPEYQERFGAADDCREGNRPKVAPVERSRFVWVHEEYFARADCAASLPGRERASAAIALAGGADIDSIDRDGEAGAADGLGGQRQ